MYKIWAKALTEANAGALDFEGKRDKGNTIGLLLWGYRYSRDSPIQGSRNLVSEKCLHNICICYLY